MLEYLNRNIDNGPMFCTSQGNPIKASEMENSLFQCLERVQECRPDLIDESVTVTEEYGIYRSFRHGSTSEVANRGASAEVIDANNWWHKVNHAGSRQVLLLMREHYTDVRLALSQLLCYSSVL